MSKDVQALSTNVTEVRSEIKVLEARVTTAIVVNVGAYIAPAGCTAVLRFLPIDWASWTSLNYQVLEVSG